MKTHGLPDAGKVGGGDTGWADGLRGLASIGVVSSHVVLSFARHLAVPCHNGRDGPSYLFQKPIFRLVAQGQSFVALFFILMGFVNSLRPLKQAQANRYEDALRTLARSSLNRSARLVLPAVTVTFMAWLACQLGFFEVSRQSDAYWLQTNSKAPSATWREAVVDLFKYGILNTWLYGLNEYDQPQWAMKWLLMGSMSIFLVLLVTITMRPSFRIFAVVVLYFYSWVNADFLISNNIYFGMLLAQLHTFFPSRCLESNFLRQLSVLVFSVLGLYLMSFPGEYYDDAPWSRSLAEIGLRLKPAKAPMPQFWQSIGAQILCITINYSPDLKKLLASRPLKYLGGVSFSLYLLHGPLMRSVLAYMTYAPAVLQGWTTEQEGDQYQMPRPAVFLLILPVFFLFLLAAVHIWSVKVEPVFAKATRLLEQMVTGSSAGPRSPLIALDVPQRTATYYPDASCGEKERRSFESGRSGATDEEANVGGDEKARGASGRWSRLLGIGD